MGSPWISIAVIWLVALVLGGVLWQRFTRVPVSSGFSRSSVSPTSAPATRRVLPLWLALVLLVLLIAAVWLTVRVAGSG
jgi:hypothetical protein